MEKVLDFIKQNTILKPGDNVIIGLSGGPDSMVLLNHLIFLKNEFNFNIICAHVHHNLRKESDEEALFVEKYCLEQGLIYELRKLEYNTKFTEDLGHKLRYAFFEELIDKYHAKYLFTAHHGDDLVETILMRIVRGASLKGYSGFDIIAKREQYTILRPLVLVTKEEIIKYAKDYKIPYVIDNSNNSLEYTRNRYRQKILPLLKEEDNNVHLKAIKYSTILNDYYTYVEKVVNDKYPIIVKDNTINITLINQEELLIIREIIKKWLFKNYHDKINLIKDVHVDNIINLIKGKNSNIRIDIPNYQVIRAYNQLSLSTLNDIDDYKIIINDIVSLPNNYMIIRNDSSNMTNNYVTHLNSKELALPLYVRNYQPGDRMTIKNFIGHKKVSDIFTNEKIAQNDRKSYPVVVDQNGEIIWLPGIKKSSFDRKKDGKYDIILEYIKERSI